MKTLVASSILLSFLQAQASTGLQQVTCVSSDLRTPIWSRELYVELEDPYQNLIVARELSRNTCELGLKNTIYLGECKAVNYQPIACN